MENDAIELLEKTSYGRGDYDKYYIDCSRYSSDSKHIKGQEILQNTQNKDVAILHAIATDDSIGRNRHIVVKISGFQKHNSMAEKEFQVGHQLHQFKLSGFMRFICLFPCFDDTSRTSSKMKERAAPVSTDIQICNAKDHILSNYKHVLVMPYLPIGSIARYEWTVDNLELLKTIAIHTILSLANAFDKTGFLHNDLNWGNILFKKTTIREITYDFDGVTITVPTNGYKIVITDFEKVYWEPDNKRAFWVNIYMFFARADITNTAEQLIVWQKNKIEEFVIEMRDGDKPVRKIVKLLELIRKSVFDISDMTPTKPYDPNVYG